MKRPTNLKIFSFIIANQVKPPRIFETFGPSHGLLRQFDGSAMGSSHKIAYMSVNP